MLIGVSAVGDNHITHAFKFITHRDYLICNNKV